MPAALEVDHEQVKAVALQIGVREAARQFGLSEAVVMQWSKREKWLAHRELVEEARTRKIERQGLSAVVRKTPSEILLGLGERSKLRAAKLGDNTLRVLQRKAKDSNGESLIPLAPVLKTTVDTLDKVHSWSTPSPSLTQINVNLGSTDLRDSPKQG